MRLAKIINDDFDYLLVDDCRYPNEITAWYGKGYDVTTVRIERPNHGNALTYEQRKHISETSLDNYSFDLTLTADSLAELEEQIRAMLMPQIAEKEDNP